MSDGRRSRLNRKVRAILDSRIQSLAPGDRFLTHEVVAELTSRNRCWRIEVHQVANLIREREDVHWISPGVWQRVP